MLLTAPFLFLKTQDVWTRRLDPNPQNLPGEMCIQKFALVDQQLIETAHAYSTNDSSANKKQIYPLGRGSSFLFSKGN